MSLIPIDEVVHFDVITSDPADGAAIDADSPPTFDVFEEGTDTPILDDQAMTKRTSLTGNYRGSFTASAANGFEAGKWYSVVVSATVDAVAGKCVAKNFRVAPAESSAGVPKGDVSHFGGSAGTFSGGRPEVNTTHAAGTAWGSGAITAASIANDAITDAKVASDVTIASVTGAVGSVTGNVGGNVAGSVGSVTAGVSLADGAITAAKIASDAITADKIAADAIGASELAAGAVSEIQSGLATASALATAQTSIDDLPTNAELATAIGDLPTAAENATAVWASGTRTVTAATNITSTGGTTVPQTGDSFARIGANGASLSAVPWNASWDAEIQSEVADALEETIADSVPSDGTRPSVKQALYMLTQFMLERSVSSTTVTVKKPDGSTSLFTLTLDDATSPTSITRAS